MQPQTAAISQIALVLLSNNATANGSHLEVDMKRKLASQNSVMHQSFVSENVN